MICKIKKSLKIIFSDFFLDNILNYKFAFLYTFLYNKVTLVRLMCLQWTWIVIFRGQFRD